MSDEDSYSSQPPALEDAEIDDVSSDASFVSDSSASVSIATDASGEFSDGEGDGPDNNALGKPFIVPLKAEVDESRASPNGSRRPAKGREEALERNSLRRQSSSKMLGDMRAAGRNMADEPRRRSPRTKSGDGVGDEMPRRRPPPRTKSGEGMVSPRTDAQCNLEGGEELSPPRDKEEILTRNMARRQKSSEMLLAMRDSTRTPPGRSKSSGAALQRRPPARTTSGSVKNLTSDDQRPPRRPPPRTKSGDGMSLLRTKPVDVPKP